MLPNPENHPFFTEPDDDDWPNTKPLYITCAALFGIWTIFMIALLFV